MSREIDLSNGYESLSVEDKQYLFARSKLPLNIDPNQPPAPPDELVVRPNPEPALEDVLNTGDVGGELDTPPAPPVLPENGGDEAGEPGNGPETSGGDDGIDTEREAELRSKNMDELRDLLRDQDKPTTGNKDELVARLLGLSV